MFLVGPRQRVSPLTRAENRARTAPNGAANMNPPLRQILDSPKSLPCSA